MYEGVHDKLLYQSEVGFDKLSLTIPLLQFVMHPYDWLVSK